MGGKFEIPADKCRLHRDSKSAC